MPAVKDGVSQVTVKLTLEEWRHVLHLEMVDLHATNYHQSRFIDVTKIWTLLY